VHGELLKLGIDISERTVSRLMPRKRKLPSQIWKALMGWHSDRLPFLILNKNGRVFGELQRSHFLSNLFQAAHGLILARVLARESFALAAS
jgi:hypothetical protein